MNELTISKELAGLEKSKARQIEAVFAPMVKMLKEFEAVYDEIAALEINPDTCKKAKRLRLDIAKVRIDADKVRKEQKEEYLRAGNAIQGVYNILKFAVADKEEKLKDIETHYERIEAEKKARLQAERELELVKFDVDGSTLALGAMDDVVWDNFLSGAKANHEAVIEAERKAEWELILKQKKEKVYRERQTDLIPYAQFGALDLLTEDTTNEKYDQIVSAMKGRLAVYEKEQAEIRAENKRLKVEAEEADQKAEEEREAKEKLEREIAAEKAEAERKAKEEANRKVAAERKAQLAPDKEKLTIIATDVLIKIGTVTSTAAKEAIQAAHDIILNTAERM